MTVHAAPHIAPWPQNFINSNPHYAQRTMCSNFPARVEHLAACHHPGTVQWKISIAQLPCGHASMDTGNYPSYYQHTLFCSLGPWAPKNLCRQDLWLAGNFHGVERVGGNGIKRDTKQFAQHHVPGNLAANWPRTASAHVTPIAYELSIRTIKKHLLGLLEWRRLQ